MKRFFVFLVAFVVTLHSVVLPIGVEAAETRLNQRVTSTDGVLMYGANNILSPVNEFTLNKATATVTEDAVTVMTTNEANDTDAGSAWIYFEPIQEGDGTVVIEYDAISVRSHTGIYLYTWYGTDRNNKKKMQKNGDNLTITSPGSHWTIVMTTKTVDGAQRTEFKVYKAGKEQTLSGESSSGVDTVQGGRLMFQIGGAFKYDAEKEKASSVTISNLSVYKTTGESFAGQKLENGNIEFNLPLKSCTATLDGESIGIAKVEETQDVINQYAVNTEDIGAGPHTVQVEAEAIDGQKTTVTYTVEGEYPAFGAEITKAYGGADSIISMTFDDGKYNTALFLNEQFRKYGLRGSCMMIANQVDSSNESQTEYIGKWQDIFDDGYLEPECHTWNHMALPTQSWADKNGGFANNTPENYQKQLVYSKEVLEKSFGRPIIALAPSNNTLSSSADGFEDGGAYGVVVQHYYGVRSGSRGIQSLDPENGIEGGQWHNLRMRGFSDNKNDIDKLCEYVDTVVEQKGWWITMCHGIQGPETSGDITAENAEALFRYISEYQKEGKVWCTTFGEAIKYVRERQASTLDAEQVGDKIFLDLTMAEETSDGLPLLADIFCAPLTVKVVLPADWDAVTVTQNGENQNIRVVETLGVKYAYVDVVPNSGQVTLTKSEAETPAYEIGEITTSATEGVYKDGTLSASVEVSNNEGCLPMTLCLAQYDKDGSMIQCVMDTVTLTRESRQLSVSMTVDAAADTTAKVMLLETESLAPYCASVPLQGGV